MKAGRILPGILGSLASLAGLVFAAFSTHDYAQHLDRQLHGTHCSFIPGLTDVDTGDNACKVAMYSPFSAILKDRFWGGIPISLFALGAFACFFALAVYLLLAGDRVSMRVRQAFVALSLAPVVASVVMFVISLTKLGALCKLCVGIYLASGLLFAAAVLSLLAGRRAARDASTGRVAPTIPDADSTVRDARPWHQPSGAAPTESGREAPPSGSVLAALGLAAALGVSTAAPALVYASTHPNYTPRIQSCGTLEAKEDKHKALVHVKTASPSQSALFFEDPLCPTCKAVHERLVAEGAYDKLDLRVSILPLDNECNWMMTKGGKNLHPGACVLARAFLCGDASEKARQVLDWSYEEQERLRALGEKDPALVRAEVKKRFPDLDACIDSKETTQRLDHALRFAVDNKVRLTTPQVYLGGQRLCDEDADMGLPYALGVLAPSLRGGSK
jgi:uncharacterized membrane protein